MSNRLEDEITRSRVLLRNPYAYLNSEGEFEAESRQPVPFEVIRKDRVLRGNQYAHLDSDGNLSALGSAGSIRKQESGPGINVDDLRDPILLGQKVSFERIEEIVRAFHLALWGGRERFWSGNTPKNPLGILDPATAFRSIGYRFVDDMPIGQMATSEGPVEVAGIIDEARRYAGVSNQAPIAMRRFTAAHELGHAVMHHAVGLHRDRGLDGSPVPGARSRVEVEADRFAVCFLMPTKLIAKEFESRFGCPPFDTNDANSFGLIAKSSDDLRAKCRNLRGLALELATATQFSGRHFLSLAELFCVSKAAMAIRLEELDLVRF